MIFKLFYYLLILKSQFLSLRYRLFEVRDSYVSYARSYSSVSCRACSYGRSGGMGGWIESQEFRPGKETP